MRLITLIFLTHFTFADTFSQKSWKPLEKIDFSSHKWQLIYTEKTDNDTSATWKFWILDNTRTIDSLKRQFIADYEKQGDGFKEYYVYLFRDNYRIKGIRNEDYIAIYGSKKYFSLGKIKKSLTPVSKNDYICPNLDSLNTLILSLNINKIMYTISQADSNDRNLIDFSIRLDMHIRYESKLISESKSSSLDNTEIVIQELERLFPELPKGNIIAKSTGGNLQFLVCLNSNKYFKFDIARFKQSDLFLKYSVRANYIVTTYSKL